MTDRDEEIFLLREKIKDLDRQLFWANKSNEALGSLLLSVQDDCIKEHQRVVALETELKKRSILKEVNADISRKAPEYWQVGHLVEFTRDMDYGPNRGSRGRIREIRFDDRGKPGAEYQVFWVVPLRGGGVFWTTPADVTWIPEDE